MNQITVTLNEKSFQLAEGTTLDAFISSLGLDPKGMAIAINYEVVPKSNWINTILSDRLELMMIHAVSGG